MPFFEPVAEAWSEAARAAALAARKAAHPDWDWDGDHEVGRLMRKIREMPPGAAVETPEGSVTVMRYREEERGYGVARDRKDVELVPTAEEAGIRAATLSAQSRKPGSIGGPVRYRSAEEAVRGVPPSSSRPRGTVEKPAVRPRAVAPDEGGGGNAVKAAREVFVGGRKVGELQKIAHRMPVMDGRIRVGWESDFTAWYFIPAGGSRMRDGVQGATQKAALDQARQKGVLREPDKRVAEAWSEAARAAALVKRKALQEDFDPSQARGSDGRWIRRGAGRGSNHYLFDVGNDPVADESFGAAYDPQDREWASVRWPAGTEPSLQSGENLGWYTSLGDAKKDVERRVRRLREDAWGGKPGPNAAQVGPEERRRLAPLIKHYMSKPHPFTACVRDNTKRFGEERAKRVCAVVKDLGAGTTKWRKGRGGKLSERDVRDAVERLVEAAGDADAAEEFLLLYITERGR